MQHIKSKDTKIELILRKALWDEAVILLVSPQQTTQITFKKANIKKIER